MTIFRLPEIALAAAGCAAVLAAAGQAASLTSAGDTTPLPRYRAGMAAVVANRADFAECDVGDSITAGVNTVGASQATNHRAHIVSALGQRYLMMKRAGVPVSMASVWGDAGAYAHGFDIEQVTQGSPLTVTTHGGWTSAYRLDLGVFGASAPFVATRTGVSLDFAATDGLSYDTADLYYITRSEPGQSGAFTMRIDSGPASAALDTKAPDGVRKLTLSFPATTNPALHVSAIVGAPLVYAVEFRSATIHRLLLRNMAGGGSKTIDFARADHPWAFIPAFPTYGCGLTKIMLLTNDYTHHIDPATTRAALTALFTTTTASSEVIFETPPPGSTTSGFAPQAPYYAAALTAARNFSLPIWDWNAREGSWARMVSEGTMGPGDALHPTPVGYRDEGKKQFVLLRRAGGF